MEQSFFDKIGGRKFAMAVVIIIAAAAVDTLAANGLSVNLLGLMTAVYATFSASNAIITNKQLSVETNIEAEGAPIDHDGVAVQQLASTLLPVVENIGKALDDLHTKQEAQTAALSTQTKALNIIVGALKK